MKEVLEEVKLVSRTKREHTIDITIRRSLRKSLVESIEVTDQLTDRQTGSQGLQLMLNQEKQGCYTFLCFYVSILVSKLKFTFIRYNIHRNNFSLAKLIFSFIFDLLISLICLTIEKR